MRDPGNFSLSHVHQGVWETFRVDFMGRFLSSELRYFLAFGKGSQYLSRILFISKY